MYLFLNYFTSYSVKQHKMVIYYTYIIYIFSFIVLLVIHFFLISTLQTTKQKYCYRESFFLNIYTEVVQNSKINNLEKTHFERVSLRYL